MSRYARRQDASQGAIVRALACCGLAVRDLSYAGRGCPDVVVSWAGRTALVECKTAGCQYGKRLNEQQQAWLQGWEGEVVTLKTAEEAMTWAQAWKRRAA